MKNKSVDELKEKSIEKTFADWKIHYMPKGKPDKQVGMKLFRDAIASKGSISLGGGGTVFAVLNDKKQIQTNDRLR